MPCVFGSQKSQIFDDSTRLESATKDISKVSNPKGFEDNKNIAQRGGSVAAVAKAALEEQTGVPVISPQNAMQLNHVVQAMIEASASAVSQDE